MKDFFRTIFLQADKNRLRSGWRLLVFLLMLSLATSGTTLALLSRGLNPEQIASRLPTFTLVEGLLALEITLIIYLLVRWLDRQPFVSLGLRWDRQARHDVAIGFGLSALLMGFIFLAEAALGWLRVEGFLWQELRWEQGLGQVGLAFFLFLLVGWLEELVARGYLLQTLADGLGMTWAIWLSSLFFSAGHLGNPNVTWASVLGILAAGLFLAYAYLKTGQLWLSIGLHWGWNFFEGVVFGFPVSGMAHFPRLIQPQVDGPVLWTGGAFGPEAGLIVLPALALGAWLIARYARGREEAAA